MSLKKTILTKAGQLGFFLLNLVDKAVWGGPHYSPEETRNDPYRWYKTLRSKGSVLRSYANRGWFVLGFDEVQAAFREPRFGSDLRGNKFLVSLLRTAADGQRVPFLDEPSMINLDAPDHTRLRKLVSHGFLRKYIESLEPNISVIVEHCLADIDPDADTFDLMEKLAKPLPAIVIAEMLGLAEQDREQFQIWSAELLGLTVIDDSELLEKGNIANIELINYFTGVIEEKRKKPGQDLICQLIAAEEEGDRLTAREMYSTCVLLLIAGHETTTRLICNGMYSLLQHPSQLSMLQQDPGLIPNAIEEMLRFEPPVQLMPRFAKEDLEFYGKKIKKDQMLLIGIASANRDESANEMPDKFDITRESVTHVSFGYGIHLCLGLSLARLEARVAINALLQRFPQMTLADQKIEWSSMALIRGMERLIIKTT